MAESTTYSPFTTYGMNTDKTGVIPSMSDWAAEGIKAMQGAPMGVPKYLQGALNRDAMQLEKLNYLTSLGQTGTLNQTLGLDPGLASDIMKQSQFGGVKGVASNAKFMRDEYLAAVQKALEVASNTAPKQEVEQTKKPNQWMQLGGSLLSSAGGGLMMNAGAGK